MNDSFILRDRQWRETNERVTLSSYAMLSEESKGRFKKEDQDPFRTVFERDRDRICLLYTSPSPRDGLLSRMPSSA